MSTIAARNTLRKVRATAPWPEFPETGDAKLDASVQRMWQGFRQQLDRMADKIAELDANQVKRGMIVQWKRPLAEIPQGWHLCDGTHGTTDLRKMFIKCVDSGEEPGGTGGAEQHTPAGTNSTPVFTGAPGTTSPVSAGTPVGTFTGEADQETSEDTAGTPAGTNDAPAFTGTPGTTGSAGDHDHAFTAASTAATPDLVAPDTAGTGVAPAGTTGTAGAHAHSFTPAGDVAAPIFTGDEMAVHKHLYTPLGTVELEKMPPHAHVFTPAGEVAAPAFTGAPASYEPLHYKLAFIEKL